MHQKTRVALAGFGVEGKSALRYYSQQSHVHITILDEKPPAEAPEGIQVVSGPNAFSNLADFDVVVRSPSIPPQRLNNPHVTSVTNEFLRVVPTKNIVGVTGSKGKGTTSSLIHAMLKNAGKRVHLGGNIGVPALDLLPEILPDDVVVLELSSFQLWDVTVSPHIAVVLMIEPEHQDVHRSVGEYVQAKSNIAVHQMLDDIIIYLPHNEFAEQIAAKSKGRKIPYGERPGAEVINNVITIDGQAVCLADELGIPGVHNVQNACAAVTAAWQYTHDVTAIATALREFTGLPHRLKYVDEVKGVRYYDDSIATTPTSVMAAVQAVTGQKILILGGAGKGADYTELAQHIANASDVRAVLLVGDVREQLLAAFRRANAVMPVQLFDRQNTMVDIVNTAAKLARSGDAVVLSPAATSFDMFKNYKDRGEQFIAAVEQLPR